MEFAGKVWRLLIGIKDGLALAFLLLFFMALYAALAAQAPLAVVRQGALTIRLDGAVVEEPAGFDASALLSGSLPVGEVRERDVVLALRAAAKDDRIRAVVIDLSRFMGGGLVHLEEIGAAMDAVRAAHKPVFVYGFALEDGGTLLAAHASEAWIDPMGGAFLPGPGGYHMYYGKLLDRLMITEHVYRVGTYKDYVEPYIRNSASDASRAATKAVVDAIWTELKANIARARPHAKIDLVTHDPVGWYRASGGDSAQAALAAGLIDHIGTKQEFGDHVAKIAGADALDKRPGAYAHTNLATFLAAHPLPAGGKVIGVVTVAGDIVDGKEGPGVAGGDRIAAIIDDAASRSANSGSGLLGGGDMAALVVRVDSPGGTVTAAEAIRRAILRAQARGLPVVVSMANVAASGGYWVSTPGAKIFAQPGTITGSIGIFAVIPSYEKLLAHYGVNGDGYRSTPISGQPDALTGFTPEIEAMLQAGIENGYRRFVALVATARHQTPAAIDTIAQGRVWDGGTARRIGLVDQFGGLDEALTAAASAAHLGTGDWHEEDLHAPPTNPLAQLLAALGAGHDDDDDDALGMAPRTQAPRDWVGLVAQHQRLRLASALGETRRLLADDGGARAYCLACAGLSGLAPPGNAERHGGIADWLAAALGFWR